MIQESLKIYAYDFGWMGCRVVAARSRTEAWEKMKSFNKFDDKSHKIEGMEEFEFNGSFEYEC